MNKKIITTTIYVIAIILILTGLFITADYFAVFGTKTNTKLEFTEVRFRTTNAETGDLVLDVGVRCFQKNNNNACTRRDSGRVGIVSVHIPFRRVVESSLFFKQSAQIIKAADPKLHVMLLHHDYHNPTQTLLLDEVYAKKQNQYTIKMKPRDWGKQEEQMHE